MVTTVCVQEKVSKKRVFVYRVEPRTSSDFENFSLAKTRLTPGRAGPSPFECAESTITHVHKAARVDGHDTVENGGQGGHPSPSPNTLRPIVRISITMLPHVCY
jgi:hypothetical protein